MNPVTPFPAPALPSPAASGLSARDWLWPIAMCVVVVIASGRSQVAAPGITGIDKVAHLLVFGLIGTLVTRTQRPARWWLGILAASSFGALDEWRQSLTPGRSGEFADWVADTWGAILAVALYIKWPAWQRMLEWEIFPRRQQRVDLSPQPISTSAHP